MKAFDSIFVNGRILAPEALAEGTGIAVAEGRVVAVAQCDELRNGATNGTKIVDLDGGTLVPGFEDAHAHVWKIGQLLTTSLDLRGVGSISEIRAKIAARVKVLPKGSWLLGRGFNEISLVEGRIPTCTDLDDVSYGVPVLLARTCGHIFVANSKAMELAGITRNSSSPDGGIVEKFADGRASGILHETAVGMVNRVIPIPTRTEYRAMLIAALQHQLSVGITASSDCGVLPALLDCYLEMAADGTLPARMNVMPLARPDGTTGPLKLPQKFHSDLLRVDTVKFLADGGLSGGTAALSVPYKNSASCGVTRFRQEELKELFHAANSAGWRIATHAIGDEAIEQVLASYESLEPSPTGFAHRMEHVGLPSVQQLQRMARANIMAVTQPIFLDELGANFGSYLPESLNDRVYPIRSMLAAGLCVSFSSDAPVVVNDSPVAGMKAAALRRTRNGEVLLANEAVSVAESLWAYTVGSATASGEELQRGRIREGYWADFVLLDSNPLTTDIESLDRVKVMRTYLGGVCVFES